MNRRPYRLFRRHFGTKDGRKLPRSAGPATVPNSAGAFVCDDTLYSLLHHYAGTQMKIGFIHIPYLPEQGIPSQPLEAAVRALTAAIENL